jgi:hypothetical protein
VLVEDVEESVVPDAIKVVVPGELSQAHEPLWIAEVRE